MSDRPSPVAPQRAVSRHRDFSPVSGEHSTALRIAMGYFQLSGWLTLALGVGMVGVSAMQGTLTRAPLAVAAAAAVIVGTGGGALWTARLPERRRRLGGVSAIATLRAPILAPVLGAGPGRGSIGTAIFAVVGAVVVASVWNELD